MALETDYQKFIHTSRYARWLDAENRRETWEETVTRYTTYMYAKTGKSWDKNTGKELESAILDLKVCPSMRAMMTAGPALERCNVAGYNCAYLPVEHIRCFDETLYILMCGTGIGFSVERQYINRLPTINEHFEVTDTSIIISDSKAGWARGLRELLSLLYSGQIPRWDVSRLRPAGARLKTFGGRSSGPDPLIDLFNFVVRIFTNAPGRKLNSLECHDIMCKIGDCVVSGGVRRSALISLSNLSDDRMRSAKSGNWYLEHGHRALANNSSVPTEKPEMGVFMNEWSSLYESKSGERGFFNRKAAKEKALASGRRDSDYEFGCNPCSEIILRPYQFCNLTEVVVKAEDTVDDLKEKVRLATILGTLQATLTDFKYLRSKWKDNTEEERLLGVSLTGIMDNKLTTGDISAPYSLFCMSLLQELKQVAIDTNKEWSKKLGINQSTSITCVKPSGTVSQLVDSASGIHPRHAAYYIRNVRGDKKDPLTQFMINSGIPCEDDVMKPDHQVVFSFPQKAPDSQLRSDLTALQHLELWQMYNENWCEHKPSITVSVKEDEWMDVGAWVYRNFDELSGVSFLPYSDHTYTQAPYEECTKEEYELAIKAMPKSIDWSKLQEYEKEDTTIGSRDFACTGDGVCEIVDIGA